MTARAAAGGSDAQADRHPTEPTSLTPDRRNNTARNPEPGLHTDVHGGMNSLSIFRTWHDVARMYIIGLSGRIDSHIMRRCSRLVGSQIPAKTWTSVGDSF
jgi:hypothetical protein